MMDPTSWGTGMMIAMMIVGLFVLGALVAGIVLLFRALSRRDIGARGSNAVDILDERFARGDIERDEYERHRDLLRRL